MVLKLRRPWFGLLRRCCLYNQAAIEVLNKKKKSNRCEMADFAPSYLANLMGDQRAVFLRNVDLFEQKKNPSLFFSEFSPTAEKITFFNCCM